MFTPIVVCLTLCAHLPFVSAIKIKSALAEDTILAPSPNTTAEISFFNTTNPYFQAAVRDSSPAALENRRLRWERVSNHTLGTFHQLHKQQMVHNMTRLNAVLKKWAGVARHALAYIRASANRSTALILDRDTAPTLQFRQKTAQALKVWAMRSKSAIELIARQAASNIRKTSQHLQHAAALERTLRDLVRATKEDLTLATWALNSTAKLKNEISHTHVRCKALYSFNPHPQPKSSCGPNKNKPACTASERRKGNCFMNCEKAKQDANACMHITHLNHLLTRASALLDHTRASGRSPYLTDLYRSQLMCFNRSDYQTTISANGNITLASGEITKSHPNE